MGKTVRNVYKSVLHLLLFARSTSLWVAETATADRYIACFCKKTPSNPSSRIGNHSLWVSQTLSREKKTSTSTTTDWPACCHCHPMAVHWGVIYFFILMVLLATNDVCNPCKNVVLYGCKCLWVRFSAQQWIAAASSTSSSSFHLSLLVDYNFVLYFFLPCLITCWECCVALCRLPFIKFHSKVLFVISAFSNKMFDK